MSPGLLAAVLLAAFLHAAWNAAVKVGASKIGAMLIVSVAEVAIGVLVVLLRPPIAPAAWPWVIAASCTHLCYKGFLTFAYERGDLSRVYPIARGAAPMLVALVGAAALPDAVSEREYAGIVVLGLGILLMARGVATSREDRRLLPFALGSALATASYTLIDGLGARVSGEPVGYVGWIFVGGGALYTLAILAWKGPDAVPRRPRDWIFGTGGAAASYGAYGISIWAMTLAPIAVVAALRETSILFAVLIGWLAFGERMDGPKWSAVALIVAGVALTRL
ncbi:DMT family transporter [Rubellimicrobium roseum]|uniref:Peptide ABC transporter permease n=1 Tax=Rubellimicrobium roseum TaxID=687525 RepID=A0A5C4NP50_9RHOB|nr:DMT family transporter [Rubellimicrobium roseum]TNC74836.1 peptide ABC transporter permease [Rubellimicrobium roseum]